ncbi:MAG: hypothetical protein HUU20_04025 [Pirellulales bacterium]|nr:hypothetical protein [Pirellulales bacterium]
MSVKTNIDLEYGLRVRLAGKPGRTVESRLESYKNSASPVTVCGKCLPMISHPAVYEDLLTLLAESADADRVLGFRLSPEKQARLDDLLEKNREGILTEEESDELDNFERFEHVVRLLKARLLQQRQP